MFRKMKREKKVKNDFEYIVKVKLNLQIYS